MLRAAIVNFGCCCCFCTFVVVVANSKEKPLAIAVCKFSFLLGRFHSLQLPLLPWFGAILPWKPILVMVC
jgi:hypothetical protein